jgi:hypothetical protein
MNFPFIFRTVKYSTLLLSILTISLAGSACAQVQLTPRYLFVQSKERSARVTAINQTDRTQESWVEIKFGYPVMDDTGRIMIIYDSTVAQPNDASSWMKAYPRRFVLDAGEQQILRIMFTPPANLPDGEYWARIVVYGKASKSFLAQSQSSGTKTTVVQISSMDIPFHFRTGTVTTQIDLDNPRMEAISSNQYRFSAGIRKSGNAAYWGSLSLRLIDAARNVVYKTDKNIVAYRDYQYTVKVDSLSVPRGEYTLQIVAKTKRMDIANNQLVQATDVERTMKFVRQ